MCKRETDGPDTCCPDLRDWLSTDLFKALGEDNRATILAELVACGSERSVSDVARCCPVDVSVVSRHLRTLREAGVLTSERRGKEVFYRVRIGELVRALRGLADALEACCPEAVAADEEEIDG